MFFSVIVPAYNCMDTIKRCILSVESSSFRDYEMIVVNDGSTDNTGAVLKEMQSNLPHLRVIETANQGVSMARNTGLSDAKGDYVVFADADDELSADALFLYHDILIRNPHADIVIGDFIKKYPQNEKRCSIYKANQGKLEYSRDKKEYNPFISRSMGTVWGKCYRRKLFTEERFDGTLSLCEDAEVNCRIFPKAREIHYIPKIVYRYYYMDTSTIRSFDKSQVKRYINALDKISDYRKDELEGFVDEFVCNVFNVICVHVICNKNNPQKQSEKIKDLAKLTKIPVFAKTFENVNMKKIPLKHRAFISLAKKKRFAEIYHMAIIYQVKIK